MGTRSLTHFVEDGKTILTLYRQMDGYPRGHGFELAKLCDVEMVNGYNSNMSWDTHANGVGCLAAKVIAKLKTGIGDFYIMPPDTSDCGEAYVYKVSVKDGRPHIHCKDTYKGRKAFAGDPSKWIAEYAETANTWKEPKAKKSKKLLAA